MSFTSCQADLPWSVRIYSHRLHTVKPRQLSPVAVSRRTRRVWGAVTFSKSMLHIFYTPSWSSFDVTYRCARYPLDRHPRSFSDIIFVRDNVRQHDVPISASSCNRSCDSSRTLQLRHVQTTGKRTGPRAQWRERKSFFFLMMQVYKNCSSLQV